MTKSHDCSSLTSCSINKAASPISLASASPSSRLISVRTSLAPSSASRCASAKPRPDEAPVIRTTFFFHSSHQEARPIIVRIPILFLALLIALLYMPEASLTAFSSSTPLASNWPVQSTPVVPSPIVAQPDSGRVLAKG